MENNNKIELEEWKEIPGYEGLYEVSDLGNVRSIDRWVTTSDRRKIFYKGKTLKQSIVIHGRLRVSLSKEGKTHYKYSHTLVALAFIGERPEGYDVCHINGNNQDNRLVNLRYDTKSQNRIDNYRYGKKAGGGKLSVDEVLEIRRLYSTGNYNQRELGEVFNISVTNIRDIINRKIFSWLNDDGTIQESETAVSLA